jgi:hypothetical protein
MYWVVFVAGLETREMGKGHTPGNRQLAHTYMRQLITLAEG